MVGRAMEFLPAHDEGDNIDETQRWQEKKQSLMTLHVPGREWGFSKYWLWIWLSAHPYKGTFRKMVLNRENYKLNLYP